MNLESPKILIHKPAEEIFKFLVDIKNFRKLMPESVNEFKLISDFEFMFALNGMPKIALVKKSEIPYKSIIFKSNEKLDFSLKISINIKDVEKSEVQFFFDGNFNSMMTMMIKGPVSKFIEDLCFNIKKI